jgi:hypothetical protein
MTKWQLGLSANEFGQWLPHASIVPESIWFAASNLSVRRELSIFQHKCSMSRGISDDSKVKNHF